MDDVAGPTIELGRMDINHAIRELMDVARVALQPHMGQVGKDDARAVIAALLAMVGRSMPGYLQNQDRRVIWARTVLEVLSAPDDNVA